MGALNDPRTLHHYTYAFNNPVNFVDPSGLMPLTLQRPREQRQNAPFQNLTNNYSAQSATQVGYAGPAGRGGFNRAYMGQPGQASGIGSQRAATGPEAQNWHRFSDPQPKQQSQGHRSKVCGFTNLLFGFGNSALSGNLLKDVFEFATHIPTLARPIMPLLQNMSKMMLSMQLGRGGLIQSPSDLFAGDDVFTEWFKGQLEDIKLAWDQADWKTVASLSFGFGTSLVVMGLASSRVGAPMAILAGAASVVLNTTFNAWLYDDWGNFWANLAGSSVEMAFSLAGGLIGGPQGWIIGNVLGSAAGQITTNVLSGQQWDRGLLTAMLFSVVSEGVGGAIGHGLGKWLGGGLDVAESHISNSRRTFSPEMEAGLEILEQHKPDYAELIRNGTIPLEEGPRVGVSGGISLSDRIIVSTDPKYPLSTAATLYEEIYHTFQGPGPEQVIELEAKAAKAKWVSEVADKTGLEFNRFPGVSGDILAFEQGGIEGLTKWLASEYGRNPKAAGMLYGKGLNDDIIEIYGFRGTGKTAEEFIETDPLIYAGHIGISFDRGKTIYGFTPFAPGLSNTEAIEVLKQHQSFPGQVLDDTSLFHRAQNLAEQGYRTQVYVQSISVSKADFARIKEQVLNELSSGPLPNKRYAFPGPEGCFNCATWPSSHGIPIPESSGNLRLYIEELQKVGQLWKR